MLKRTKAILEEIAQIKKRQEEDFRFLNQRIDQLNQRIDTVIQLLIDLRRG
ncbi:MAG: hypothetical protein ACK4ZR_03195 [Aquificaceae bacterium]